MQQVPDFNETQSENEAFLTEQLITYIGNKRYLLNFISKGIDLVRDRLNTKKISSFDVFSGSGAVSRYLKQFSHTLITNDLEEYACLINRCYLTNRSETDMSLLQTWHAKLLEQLEDSKLTGGFIRELYAPADMHSVKNGERCFYTPRNAMYLDTARNLINTVPENLRHFFLAPLLSEASIHANTSGVFKGFYKDSSTGRGQFGGNNKDALTRILGNIELKLPVFSNFECKTDIRSGDANIIAQSVPEVDLAYLDPPYNQHPYGSNYFMLNLLLHYTRPGEISTVSGIPADWKRSNYNKRQKVQEAMKDLVEKVKAKFLLVSFNSEGFIGREEMVSILNTVGKTEVLETKYNTFRGSRNLGERNIHVKEYLYLVEKN
ncbi:MAG TPA: DNA adenine methylase [Treponemataceae bacterium]|nr:DNA adenine methylase [Treponemataceae bacterium]